MKHFGWIGLLALTGCHATFRRHAPQIDSMRVQAFATTAPHVRLGRLQDPGLFSAAVDAYQGSQELRAERRLREAVEIGKINDALVSGVREALGDGPPFPYTDDPAAEATLQVEVLNYGLEVPFIGAQGTFEYDLRLRMYFEDPTTSGIPKRVYSARVNCNSAAGAPTEVSLAFGTVNNVRQVEQMNEDEIQDAFEVVAEWCAWEVVRKMRRHAS